MPLSDVFEKLGRAILESPFAASRVSADVPELAEIRLVALDAIKQKSQRVGGKLVFPFSVVRVSLLGVPAQQIETFHSAFLATYLNRELRGGLDRASYRYPDDLTAEIHATSELPGARDKWIHVDMEMVARPAGEPKPGDRTEAVLVLAAGSPQETEFRLTKTRTNIGRTVDVFRTAGPSRRNDIAFADDNEANRSISREHGHIIHEPGSEDYRIFNDRWYDMGAAAEANCGLWLVRDGLSQPVHRNSRGMALHDGDEIHLGRVVMLFSLRPKPEAGVHTV